MQSDDLTTMVVGLISEQALAEKSARQKALVALAKTTEGMVRDLDALKTAHLPDTQDYVQGEEAIRQRAIVAHRIFTATCRG